MIIFHGFVSVWSDKNNLIRVLQCFHKPISMQVVGLSFQNFRCIQECQDLESRKHPNDNLLWQELHRFRLPSNDRDQRRSRFQIKIHLLRRLYQWKLCIIIKLRVHVFSCYLPHSENWVTYKNRSPPCMKNITLNFFPSTIVAANFNFV